MNNFLEQEIPRWQCVVSRSTHRQPLEMLACRLCSQTFIQYIVCTQRPNCAIL